MKLLLALVAAAPIFAQCTFTVNPAVFNLPAGDAKAVLSGVANVGAPAECMWQAKVSADSADWITIYTNPSAQGGGLVGFQAARNPVNTPRSGTIIISAATAPGNPTPSVTATVTVNQAAQVCVYTISPATQNFPVGGGAGIAQVGASCNWGTGTSDSSWILLPQGAQGTFDGRFNYNVAPNPCLGARTGLMGVGLPGSTVTAATTITQDGSPNNLVVSPATATLGTSASDGKLNVTIGDGCQWGAFSEVSWLQITSPASATGSGTLTFHADANPSSPRTGNIRVGPQVFTVTQQALAAPPIKVTAVINAASGLKMDLSPGEIVSIFGSNMGPTAGVGLQLTADGKSITKSLGGVQVLFDDIPAALTFVSASQINAVVPYGLAGEFDATVQVKYNGASSNVLTVGFGDAGPGVFTQDASGIGAGAILNQDFTVNANSNRAARGSVVQIFCTGGGPTLPASVDGALTLGSTLPQLVEKVTVTIGGAIAEVTYAGAAPNGIAGFTQINVIVPAIAIPGPTLPVVVGIGAWASQSGVTLAVK